MYTAIVTTDCNPSIVSHFFICLCTVLPFVTRKRTLNGTVASVDFLSFLGKGPFSCVSYVTNVAVSACDYFALNAALLRPL